MSTKIKRSAPCACDSGLPAKDCCYPAKPPINMSSPPYVREEVLPSYFHSNAPEYLWDIIKNELGPITITESYKQNSGPGILSKQQVNRQIAEVLGYSLNAYHLNTQRNEHTLISPLHVIKYHQQQCMYRLYYLESKARRNLHENHKRKIRLNHAKFIQIIQFEDLPLRAEFEAFTSRIASALDAIGKYVVSCTGDQAMKGSHFGVSTYLEKQLHLQPVQEELKSVYLNHKNWAREIFNGSRNVVMHEGTLWTLEPGRDISEQQTFVPPSAQGNGIDQLCVDYWKRLIDFVQSIRTILLRNNLTT